MERLRWRQKQKEPNHWSQVHYLASFQCGKEISSRPLGRRYLISKSQMKTIVNWVVRKNGYKAIKTLTRNTSQLVRSEIIKDKKAIACKIKTINFNNGREFPDHAKTDESLDLVSYFTASFLS